MSQVFAADPKNPLQCKRCGKPFLSHDKGICPGSEPEEDFEEDPDEDEDLEDEEDEG